MKILNPGDKIIIENIELDRSVLQKMAREIGDENVISLVGLFIDELDLHLDQIQRAAKAPDLLTLKRSGHTLKSSAASFGATGVSRLAGKMEKKAMQKDTAGAQVIATKLLDKAQSARAHLLISISPPVRHQVQARAVHAETKNLESAAGKLFDPELDKY